MWQALFQRCEVEGLPDEGCHFVSKPTAAALDQFEADSKFLLPQGYRQFVEIFGAGELCGYFRIATPMIDANDYELGQFNRDWHGDPSDGLLDVFGLGADINRFLFFCSTIGGEGFAWRTDEITSENTHECAIYQFPNSPRIKHIANSFQSFIEEYVTKADPTRNWTPSLTFLPFQLDID